jgi:hypothetical protein
MKSSLRRMIIAVALTSAPAFAAETVLPQSALVPDGNLYTTNIGANTLARNDDLSTGLVNFGFNFTMFGNTYNGGYLNNNGNITFNEPLSEFIPSGVLGAEQPIVSIFFGDVDTRPAGSGLLHYQTDTAGQLVATWDNVGYYNQHDDKLNSFQLVLRGDNFSVPAGEGQIGFFYQQLPWEVTDTSTTVAAGFGNGAGSGFTIQGSNQPGFPSVLQNHHIWFNVSGNEIVVVTDPGNSAPVPEPISSALFATGLGLMGWHRRRKQLQAS